MRNIIYIINEIKGVTENLRTSVETNVVRDRRGNGKAFTAVSLNQPTDAVAIIVTAYHRFEMEQVEIAGGQRRFWSKTSQAIRVANTLYNRGITVTLIDYRGKEKNKITIEPDDNFYTKIDEFCGVDKKKTDRLSKEFKKAPKIQHTVTWNDFIELGLNPSELFHTKENFSKLLERFTKNCELYGLDSSNPVDMYTFCWMSKYNHSDFLAEDRFKCPHCGNIVHIHGHEEFINGKPINTGETICEHCGEEFDIHDKRDVVETYYSAIFA